MDRDHILQEIRRTASQNGGSPLGRARFETKTGIRYADWYGVHWARWGDALVEAGFAPNQLQIAFDKSELLEKYAGLARQLRRLPTDGDLRLASRRISDFPNHNTFRRLGPKAALVAALREFCEGTPGHEDVLEICEAAALEDSPEFKEGPLDDVAIGFVYLVKSGRFYKIGRSNSAGRRHYELDIQLPERAVSIHVIRTDDPPGIEAYWHKRFETKRMNGEWFRLGPADVAVFRRRKFM